MQGGPDRTSNPVDRGRHGARQRVNNAEKIGGFPVVPGSFDNQCEGK